MKPNYTNTGIKEQNGMKIKRIVVKFSNAKTIKRWRLGRWWEKRRKNRTATRHRKSGAE